MKQHKQSVNDDIELQTDSNKRWKSEVNQEFILINERVEELEKSVKDLKEVAVMNEQERHENEIEVQSLEDTNPYKRNRSEG